MRRDDKARFVVLLAVTLFMIFVASLQMAATEAKDDKAPIAQSRFAKLDGARIHYINYGKGDEALVLIHGWTQNADAWRENIAEFANHFRVIVVELPGHGQSDKPAEPQSKEEKGKGEKGKGEGEGAAHYTLYSMDHFARAVDAVMRDAKVKRAVLVGHSMGTPVARQFYRKYPEKTLGIVIVDGSLRPFGDKAVLDQLLAGLRGPNYRDAVGQVMTMISGPNISTEVKQRISSASLGTPQYVLVSAFEAMADQSIWVEDQINVPVLAIMAKSPILPANAEASFRALAPKMDFQLWDGVGHFLMMEKPTEFDAAVIAWLEKNGLLKAESSRQ
jgi:pimeloyl-ACP methyl ester carboxylesterase